MAVFDELNFLEMFFRQLTESSQMTVESLYQMVQHASSVLTRMYVLASCVCQVAHKRPRYLLTTAGAVYIRSKESPASEVLYDILGMVKSVQYPTRGLFLRYYVCQKSRSLLPDEGSEYMVYVAQVRDMARYAGWIGRKNKDHAVLLEQSWLVRLMQSTVCSALCRPIPLPTQ